MPEKKFAITNHLEGWGLITHHRALVHYFKKDVWKSICGHESLDDISSRWKVRFLKKNNNNFPDRKKCKRCLKFMKKNEIVDF